MKKHIILLFLLLLAEVAPAQIIHTIAGIGGIGGDTGDGGPATAAELQDPASVALDTAGNLYISDGDFNVIRKVDRMGIITTIAGNGWRGYSGDNGPATNAMLNSPTGLSLDVSGNIYFADLGNHVARMINTSGIITTIAGNDTAGYTGDGGAATNAKLEYPNATANDHKGNIYICDLEISVIRKVSSIGIITTAVGNGMTGYTGDKGPATNAELFVPTGIATDSIGNLFIADSRNNVIRKVDTFGIITTIAGNGMGGYSGDGELATAAQLNSPWSICINNMGIYTADLNNNVIRKIDTSGIISTVAGNGIMGYTGDGGLAVYAELTYPGGMAVDRYGNFYFGDVNNFVVREVDTSHALAGIPSIHKAVGFHVYPDPATNELTIASLDAITTLDITNDVGQVVYSATNAGVSQLHINVANFPAGIYYIKINGKEVKKFLKQ